MIVGEINAARQAIVQAFIKASGERAGFEEAIDFLIDTGFDGYISLPLDHIEKLQLPFATEQIYNLAGASQQVFALHAAIIVWDGEERGIFAVASDGPPTIGTALLHGFHLFVDWIDGGEVRIEARTKSS